MEPEVKSGFLTTEFWATLAQVAVGVVMTFVSLGFIQPGDAEAVTQNVVGVTGALGALAINVAAIWKYMAARTTLKTSAMSAGVQTKLAKTAKPADVSLSISEEKGSK